MIQSYPHGEARRLSTMYQHAECGVLLCHRITLLIIILIVPPLPLSFSLEIKSPLTLALVSIYWDHSSIIFIQRSQNEDSIIVCFVLHGFGSRLLL